MISLKTTLLTGLTGFALATASQAVIVVNNSGSSGAFTVSNSDLIEGVLGTVTGTTLAGNEGTSSNPATLTNGTFGTGGSPLDTAETVAIRNNTTLTWQLDTGASPGGYDITGINIYSGWRDAGRDRLIATARYATVADPGVFVDITSINYNPSPSNSAESLITDDSGVIASGVGEIQIFFPGQENGYAGYREVDVLGTAVVVAIPEPSALGLLGIGGLALVLRRRLR